MLGREGGSGSNLPALTNARGRTGTGNEESFVTLGDAAERVVNRCAPNVINLDVERDRRRDRLARMYGHDVEVDGWWD